jgi:Glycosyl transferase family 2
VRTSVAICTYNGAGFIAAQLESILAQSPAPDEIVVCDDLSTDSTVEIVRGIAARGGPAFRIEVNRDRLGVAHNFEKAVGLSTGDLILLSDQDDVWLPGKIARLAAAFERPEVTAAFSDARLVDAELRDLGPTLWSTLEFTPPRSPAAMLRLLQRRNVVTGATLAFRRALLPLVAPIPASPLFLHDWWIGLLAAAMGEVAAIPEPLILYRQHGGQHVGAELAGPRSRRGPALDRDAGHALQIATLRSALERLAGHGARPEALAALREQIAHLERRAALPPGRLERLPLVAAELASGRYRRWSRGAASAARDLLG